MSAYRSGLYLLRIPDPSVFNKAAMPWRRIPRAGLAGKPNCVRRDYHPALSKPALSRDGATSPALLRWMKHFNAGKPYSAQVKPFGFLVAPMVRGTWCEDRETILTELPGRGRQPKKR